MNNIKIILATLGLIIILINYSYLYFIAVNRPPTRNSDVKTENYCFDELKNGENISCNHRSEIRSMTIDVDCFQAFMFTKTKKTWVLEHKHNTTKKCKYNGTYEKCPWVCNKCTFITMKNIIGRTGNQMFQVASLFGIARKRGLIPIIPSTISIHKWFNLPTLSEVSKPINQFEMHEKAYGKYLNEIEDLDENKNWTISGYLQSFRYFNTSDNIIHELFKMKLEKQMRAEDLLRSFSRNDEIVCMHVRRGDLLKQINIKLGYNPIDYRFINVSMNYFLHKLKNITFVILSDDIPWCKESIIGENVVFSPFKEAIDDFALMMSCNHVVITSGTFGWWGAYLSGGTVVYHNGFPAKGTFLDQAMNRDDYYFTTWIGLGDND
ncbi:galactoside alpha-(1,2)-fucosyltransferase 2-like isoform X1 [Mya arenaria]|uniref:galactoside alpha-(1,2)-fucosyltransferase 2-like isoform X1 n=1 Tax=Mya arenaria TaxID=6604 RepID=UPI0022E7525F|nr:galactoside alpha-(1,2)-fucosyltransferase 2-like isoform X1 [Mya arenaria]XP_052816601.1 galactoside alpha-(1,2)-fucosyltransferase 2-like isoform X1 [Mya arenaria]